MSSYSHSSQDNRLKATNAYEVEDITEYEIERTYLKSASVPLTAIPQFIDQNNALKIKPEYVVYQPFYTDEYNDRLSNAILFDDVIKSVMSTLSNYVIGAEDEIRSILYPEVIRPLKSELEAKGELKKLRIIKNAMEVTGEIIGQQLDDTDIDQFEKAVNYSNKISGLYSNLGQVFRATHGFGRTAFYVEYTDKPIKDLGIPVDFPLSIKPLNSMYMGNVVVDPITWNIKALEYKDPTLKFREYIDLGLKRYNQQNNTSQSIGDVKYLDANNFVYFVKNNDNLMRQFYDRFFGHSTIQSILPLSEENRRMNQIVIPQINQGHWAGNLVWFFPPTYTEKAQQEFFQTMKPGGHTGVADERIKFQEVKVSYDYAGLLNLKDSLKKGILSAFHIPSFITNFEDITNRATAQTVINGFNESVIQSERSWLTKTLDEQWFARMFSAYWPDDQFIMAKMKIIMEFENVAFDSFLEKSIAVVALKEAGIMTLTECRNMLNQAPLMPSDYAELGISPPSADPNNPMVQAAPPSSMASALQQKQQQQAPAQQQNTSTGTKTRPVDASGAHAGLGADTNLSTIKRKLLAGAIQQAGYFDSNYF
jgi:hypothetical protein